MSRYERYAGLLAPPLVLGAILLATLTAPSFTWAESALSDLGVSGHLPTELLFNGGLLVGGVGALPFARALHRETGKSLMARAVAPSFALTMLSMAGVGVFQAGHPLHFPVALAFYLLATVTMALDGLARRRTRRGQAAFGLAAVHLLQWYAWVRGIALGEGLAIPETVGALLFAGWVWFLAAPAPVRPSGE